MAYPEDKKRLEKRDEELKFERMDNMLISMYVQWDDSNPEFNGYTQTKYASGRTVTKHHHKKGRPTTTWDRVRERFFAFWDRNESN